MRHVYLSSQKMFDSLSQGGLLAPWQHESYSTFVQKTTDPAFPCPFAPAAFKKDLLWYCCADYSEPGEGIDALRDSVEQYLPEVEAMSPERAVLSPLIAFVRTGGDLTQTGFWRTFWEILQGLHDRDTSPWPTEIPKEIDDLKFAFCFAGVPLFINVSDPSHVLRRSRNLGPHLTLVIQPRKGFDAINVRARQNIRERLSSYDEVRPSPLLGTYGTEGCLEWPQYFLADSDEVPSQCPLSIRREP